MKAAQPLESTSEIRHWIQPAKKVNKQNNLLFHITKKTHLIHSHCSLLTYLQSDEDAKYKVIRLWNGSKTLRKIKKDWQIWKKNNGKGIKNKYLNKKNHIHILYCNSTLVCSFLIYFFYLQNNFGDIWNHD